MQMDKRFLVVGIDPGTTTAYAILDIDGNLVDLRSSKLFNFSNLLLEIMKHGKVVVAAADTSPASEFVDKFSRVTGAKLIYPKENLKVIEKKRLTSGFEVKNVHEKDALSAALFAFKKIRPLLRKVDSYLTKRDKMNFADDIKSLLLAKEGVSITEALRTMEKTEKKITKKKRKEAVEIKPKVISKAEKENLLLKEQNKNLKIRINKILMKEKYLTKKLTKGISDDKLKKLLGFKEDRILSLTNEIDSYRKEVSVLRDEIGKLNDFLLNLDDNFLVRRFNSFSKNILDENIKEGCVLFIDNPSIVSEKVLEFLDGKGGIVITDKPITKNLKRKLNLIESKKLRIKWGKRFILVNREDLEKEKDKLNLLDKIIKDYKEKRKREVN